MGQGQRQFLPFVIAGLVPAIHGSACSVYMLANQPYGTLYIDVTNDLVRRVEQHHAGEGSTFTYKHKVHTLVWYQQFGDVRDAIQREKTLKEWPRAWKTTLVEHNNPHWVDLYPSLPGVRPITLL